MSLYDTEASYRDQIDSLMRDLGLAGQKLEQLCDALTSLPIGSKVTAPRPDFQDGTPEYMFVATTTWLSSWFTEAWRTSLDFLFGQANLFGQDERQAKDFTHILGRLRTRSVHNLDPSDVRDRRTLDECYRWYKVACESRIPDSDEQWIRCRIALLTSAKTHLSAAVAISRGIEQHSNCDEISDLWKGRLSRTGAVLDYLGLLQLSAGDLGLSDLDLRAIKERHQRRLDRSLSIMNAMGPVAEMVGHHIDRVLLSETVKVLPISAGDAMERLRLPPGENVATAMRLAQVILELYPANLDRAMLLDALSDAWNHLAPKSPPHISSSLGLAPIMG
ncbi:hypothetical protein LO762_03850 [Actinocorallia sp. API 0066]|uniref:hypothetical protein n=1 Tax=Actinocorallia sp. API 0066 TaxID=2896846 RepID=UPI001E392645|nr:hypothetical protein [Actinocorallia sp. API 0066]MCD0448333.1 hypothetical protein [Actinocorallia sp. API 0066]